MLLEKGIKGWDWAYFSLLTLLNLPLLFAGTKTLEAVGLCGVDVFEGALVLLMLVVLPVEGVLHLISYIRAGQWRHLLRGEGQMKRVCLLTLHDGVNENGDGPRNGCEVGEASPGAEE